MKLKYKIYIGIIIGEHLLTMLLAKILNVSVVNSWLAVIEMDIIAITICVILFKIAKPMENNRKYEGSFLPIRFFLFPYGGRLKVFLYFIIVLMVLLNTIGSIAFFAGY